MWWMILGEVYTIFHQPELKSSFEDSYIKLHLLGWRRFNSPKWLADRVSWWNYPGRHDEQMCQ